MTSKLVLSALVLCITMALFASAQSFAIDESTIKATKEIKNNPTLMSMLKKIEQSKKILAEMQEKKKIQEQKQLQLQQIRKTAQQSLAADLDSMNKDNEQFTPANAFARFVSSKPTQLQNIYWSMFNFQQEKVKSAKDARDKILANGGTWSQASSAYNTASAIKKAELIKLNKDFNIKYGNANVDIQNTFDVNGKLPRAD